MDRFRIRVGTDRFSEVKEDYSNLVAGMQWLLLVGSECLNAMGMFAAESEDLVAKKYGWEDVWQGKPPQHHAAAGLILIDK